MAGILLAEKGKISRRFIKKVRFCGKSTT